MTRAAAGEPITIRPTNTLHRLAGAAVIIQLIGLIVLLCAPARSADCSNRVGPRVRFASGSRSPDRHELRLIAPDVAWIDDVLHSSTHP